MEKYGGKDLLRCSDPFKKHKKIVKKDLRVVTITLRKKWANLKESDKICRNCLKELNTRFPEPEEDEDIIPQNDNILNRTSSSNEDEPLPLPTKDNFSDLEVDSYLLYVNDTLEAMGEIPPKKRKSSTKVLSEKFKETARSLKRKFYAAKGSSIDLDIGSESIISENVKEKAANFDNIISELKTAFKNTTLKAQKIRIMTITSKIWSQRKNAKEFETTRHKAKLAKEIAEEQGILGNPNPHKSTAISEEVKEDVRSFYKSDEISRTMPGKKDKVSVVKD